MPCSRGSSSSAAQRSDAGGARAAERHHLWRNVGLRQRTACLVLLDLLNLADGLVRAPNVDTGIHAPHCILKMVLIIGELQIPNGHTTSLTEGGTSE
jgi:hypothetical protein